ncbi:MAG: hypothetical protein HYV63_32720 [Candidatus Schekmanbacteria bacterium]|nr:hypothetical protein [Candidatus Schekmanbacteria bacterium]
MILARSRVEDVLGEPGLARYGLAGETPRAPEDLEAHVTNAVALFEQSPVVAEDALGTPFDSARVASGLRERLTELRGALGATARERRELESAMIERDRALVVWNDVYQGVATAWSGLFRLAGEVELAERIRPTVGRAAGLDPAPAPAPGDAAPVPQNPPA